MVHELLAHARGMEAQLVAWRRALHQMPELGLDLPCTSAYIQKELDRMGIPYVTKVGGSCVLAQLGPAEGSCFLLRSDMDALPIREETGLPFASTSGCMHACGHDLHTAILLGAAGLLKAHEGALTGPVKLLFQPGEEIFAGARVAVSEGVLERPKVAAAFGMHVSPQVRTGAFLYGSAVTASVYGFCVHIRGKGGHGSTPEVCVDPISVGVHLHLALQELISRECSPLSQTVLTIGSFQSGQAANIIPDTAELTGTLRTFDPKVADLLIRRIQQIVPAVAGAYRAEAELQSLYNIPPVLCDPALNALFLNRLGELDSALDFWDRYHTMGSEDFACISEKVPSSFFCLGCAPCEPKEAVWPHNSKTTFDEGCLPLGAACYAQAALSWQREQAAQIPITAELAPAGRCI